ncbi:zf-RVT domain-containing protein [Cephalotus follicularis]|uniref:Zf-RVT domain-containing protein n=1 Tax=Cephalotus follicularis TaxID=3775 RepID=A0A1Q3D775_CEPFO|nr:zf-RVT domain-containing protein [Cephalotus follicularis]
MFGHRAIYASSYGRDDKVEVAVKDGRWDWSEATPTPIKTLTCHIPISSQNVHISWSAIGKPFSTKNAWEAIRLKHPRVPWFESVWFKKYIPKHSFCFWITCHNARRTLDKLLCLGVVNSADCRLGCEYQESEHHLFFHYCFYEKTRKQVVDLNNALFRSHSLEQ